MKEKFYDSTYCDGWYFKSPNGQKDNDNSTFGAVHVPLFTHVPDESYHSGRFKACVVAPLVMHVVFVSGVTSLRLIIIYLKRQSDDQSSGAV